MGFLLELSACISLLELGRRSLVTMGTMFATRYVKQNQAVQDIQLN